VTDEAPFEALTIGGLAKAIHEDYVCRLTAGENSPAVSDPSLLPWESLPETLRHSNLDQAADIPRKLAAIGCRIVNLEEAPDALYEFDERDVERLAMLEHERWVRERSEAGWTTGPRDVERMTTPHLVAWNDLTEQARDLDRDAVRAIPRVLESEGLAVANYRDTNYRETLRRDG
jgi:RyR domain